MMTNFFQPQSIAIIGASANPKKLGYQILANLKNGGFEGKIFPINLDEKKILGLDVRQTVLDIHQPIDLAIIIVPREVVPLVLKQCVLKSIPHVIVISAGFAEKDRKGKLLQKELQKITERSKTRIIGPNCLGMINTERNLNLTFAASKVQSGNIGLILQSGAIGAAILDWANSQNVGISKFISLGNKMQISELDALRILALDPQTKVIAMYLEDISDVKKFLEISREVAQKKPVVILKGGLTKEGSRAAASHTAALASSEDLDLAVFKQADLIRASSYEDLLNILVLCSAKNFSLFSRNLAIVTNAGGPGILAADAASQFKMNLVRLKEPQKNSLAKLLDSFGSLENPFDLGGDAPAQRFADTISYLEKNDAVDSILVIVTPQAVTEIKETAKMISSFRASSKPVVATFLGGKKMQPALEILANNHIPHFEDPATAIEQLAKIYNYFHGLRKTINFLKIPQKFQKTDPHKIITAYQIPFIKTIEVNNNAEVMAAVEEMNFPLVYKTARAIKSKQKSGKVGLNIPDNLHLHRQIENIGFPGIVQPMVDSIYEIMVGAKADEHFGLVVTFGKGGIFVEAEKDVSFRVAPLTENDLKEMIEQTQIYNIIKDFKVIDQIKQMILKSAAIIADNSDIMEIEFNPLKVLPKKLIAVDINVVTKNG